MKRHSKVGLLQKSWKAYCKYNDIEDWKEKTKEKMIFLTAFNMGWKKSKNFHKRECA